MTHGEYLDFMADGGYTRHDLWLSAGWAWVQEHGRRAPLYWQEHDEGWRHFTLAGVRAIDRGEPVAHLSYFEAEAFARWAGGRLPSEHEWEAVAVGRAVEGHFADAGRFHPAAVGLTPDESGRTNGANADGDPVSGTTASENSPTVHQLFGDVWEWTRSDYAPYPGYAPAAGALGEYNGKFMSGQYVLRGGSCATSPGHSRATYRNFFPPEARWQFTGLRLARDAR